MIATLSDKSPPRLTLSGEVASQRGELPSKASAPVVGGGLASIRRTACVYGELRLVFHGGWRAIPFLRRVVLMWKCLRSPRAEQNGARRNPNLPFCGVFGARAGGVRIARLPASVRRPPSSREERPSTGLPFQPQPVEPHRRALDPPAGPDRGWAFATTPGFATAPGRMPHQRPRGPRTS